MSQCIVPNWNLSHHQRQDLNQAQEGNNRSSHVDLNSHHNQFQQQQHQHHHHHHQQQQQQQQQQHQESFSHLVPMSNFDVAAELTWENGQLAMHELGIFPAATNSTTSSPPKPTWNGGVGGAGDTLESIVHQATYYNNQQTPNLMPTSGPHQHTGHQNMDNAGASVVASCGRKRAESSGQLQTPGGPPTAPPGLLKKRTRSESENCAARSINDHEMSACASANATFCKDGNNNNNNNNYYNNANTTTTNNNDTTMMTWASFESPRSTRTKTTTDEDSACQGGSENQEEERETKEETGRSYTTRKGRAAAVHNLSERRRRDRINQKMKALQKLVPNASKTDKASMLDEVIEYLKQLQAQVQMMTSARFMPQLMMPLGMQQHLQQLSLLARVGMGAGLGMGLGMLDTTNMGATHTATQTIPSMIHPSQVATGTSPFVPPALVVPQMIPAPIPQTNPVDTTGTSNTATIQDPYSTLLAQSMNLELYNRMAALQRQHQQTTSQTANNQMQSNHPIQRS